MLCYPEALHWMDSLLMVANNQTVIGKSEMQCIIIIYSHVLQKTNVQNMDTSKAQFIYSLQVVCEMELSRGQMLL